MCIVVVLQVNSVGSISFRFGFLTTSPQPFPLPAIFSPTDTLIAPFWDRSDYRMNIVAQVLYRFTTDAMLINDVASRINDAFGVDFNPAWLFVATWNRLPTRQSFGTGPLLVSFYQSHNETGTVSQ